MWQEGVTEAVVEYEGGMQDGGKATGGGGLALGMEEASEGEKGIQGPPLGYI